MEFGKFILEMIKGLGLSPACVIALVMAYAFYKDSQTKTGTIEKLSDAISESTVVITEMKTLLISFLPRR